MHVFALPDARLRFAGAKANELLGTFNVFQIADDPVLRSGETFSPDADTPRRVLRRGPDARYPSGHASHNPFGVWELGPEGGKAENLSPLVPVFMPALVVLLTAAENKKGAPLTQSEVGALRDKAVCMMMKPRDVQAMERSRGYADIEPERAFEAWQRLRSP